MQSEPAVQQVPGGFEPGVESADEAGVPGKDAFTGTDPMTSGVISKLVSSYGSEWGRIRPECAGDECFFNRASLLQPDGFEGLAVGQAVEFEEERDRVHGTRAVRVAIVAGAVSEPAGIAK